MYYDYHMHSSFSHDSETSMNSMIKKSIELGLKEICFTEHVDYGVIINGEEKNITIDYNDYFSKLDYFKKINKEYISIKKGVEIGLQEHVIDKCINDVKNNDFDFVIASVHSINKYELIKKMFYKDKNYFDAYKMYYKTLYKMLTMFKEYCIVGHLDLIKRYVKVENITYDEEFSYIIDEILKLIISDGKGIEINTSCFRYNLSDFTPSTYILKRYKELGGVIITTGSDSHRTDQIAYGFKNIYEALKNMGYKYICTFEKRKPTFINI